MRAWLGAVVVGLTCVAWAAAPAAAAAARPNVVVIETDDQTASSLRYMPTVQRLLVDGGVTFDNSFVSYSLCCPSRATFLTGQYAHNHRVLDNVPPYGGYEKLDNSNTLPVWLQAAGYRTMLVGKYLNGYGRRDPGEVPPGWTDWHGLVAVSTYQYFGYTMNDDGIVRRYPPTRANYQTDVLAAKATHLIGAASRGRRPFFMWTTFVAPHFSFTRHPEPDDPFSIVDERSTPTSMFTPVPAPSDRNRFAGVPLPESPAFDEADVRDKPVTVRLRPRIDATTRAAIQENYQQELESLQAVDRAVGRIVDALRRGGALGRTLIVFTSDNGYFHGEHRLPREKVLPYEPSIRVPLVVRGPGVPRGERRAQLVSNQDLAPTILAATGARPGRVADGTSLLPLARDEHLETGRDLLIEGLYRARPAVSFAGVRSRDWKYVEYSNGERELYDLVGDPYELVNRDGDPRYAAIEDDLAARLARLRRCRGDGCRAHPRLRAAVRALGRGPSGCADAVRLRLRGPAARRVRDLDVYAAGRLVGTAHGREAAISPTVVTRAGASLRATAYLGGDRAYSPPPVRVVGCALHPPLILPRSPR